MTVKILLVDDESNIPFLFKTWFYQQIQAQDFQFIFADNGITALEALEQHHDIRIVLTDINMPRMTGLELLAEISSIDRLLHTIVLTAHSDMENIRAAMNRGAYDFLIKPLDFKDVSITLNQAINDILQKIEHLDQLKKVEEERNFLVTAIEKVPETIYITDDQGVILYVNAAFEITSGYTREEALGQKPSILRSEKQPPEFYEAMWNTLLRGETWSGHIVNKTKAGTFLEEELSITPIRDDSGTITNYVGVKRDVTHVFQLEKQLRQAQKMEAIGTLAGGIAHDFNNILFAMLGYMNMVKSDLPRNSEMLEDLQEAIKAGNRAKELVRQILVFSRQEESELQELEIAPILKEALKLLRSTIPTNIEIEQSITPEELTLVADPTQIHQVIMNLCTNAYQAMEGQTGKLGVTLEKATPDPLFLNSHSLEEGHYAKLTVCDTGQGMSIETQEKIFDPFFTTKTVGKGTGLGLSVVHGIVTNHNGKITVSSEVGKGSTFEVFLPVVESDAILESESEESYAQGNGTILVVDDEITLVKLEQRILERCGYIVITTIDSRDALNRIQTNPQSFDLLITDHTMPQMTGVELAKKVRQIRPNLPIIVITGLLHEAELKRNEALGLHTTSKPIDASTFSHLVKKLLSSN